MGDSGTGRFDPREGTTSETGGRTLSNEYSARWFSTFLDTVPADRTRAEVAFLRRNLPLERYRRVLDLACGPGRHALSLGDAGYAVTGVDVDPRALDAARERAGGDPEFVEADMRDLGELGEEFDAVICMWQSFGHFDAATNRSVLAEIAGRLRPGGRLVLDLYNRRFFEPRQGVRRIERNGIEIEERKEVRDGRLFVRLRYGDSGAVDRFEWQVFTTDEIVAVAAREGFAPRLTCREFDEARPASEDCPRMQLVFDRWKRVDPEVPTRTSGSTGRRESERSEGGDP